MIFEITADSRRSNVAEKDIITAMEGLDYLKRRIADLTMIKNMLLYSVSNNKNIQDTSNKDINQNKTIDECLRYYSALGWLDTSETPSFIYFERKKKFNIYIAVTLLAVTIPLYGLGVFLYLIYYFANSYESFKFNKIGFLENRGFFIQEELY